MKKKIFFPLIVSLLLHAPVPVTAQSKFDTSDFPQWAKDMRRWDIIAFGSFPFTMFAVTFFTDTYRWADANGMDFSEEGRRYAPWPLKTAGAELMTSREYETTMIIAASLSAAIAFTDLFIVNLKRNKERRRIESMPSGSVIINRKPYQPGEDGGEDTDDPDTE